MLLGVGYYVYRRAPSFEQYLLAGRMMTTPILICTLASTYYGLDILFGSSEIAFNDGIVAYIGYALMMLGIYLFAAISLSKRPPQANFTSLPEILERSYGRSTAVFGAIGSLLYALPSTSLFALGRISEVVFGVDARVGALALGGIALSYTLMGGLMAVTHALPIGLTGLFLAGVLAMAMSTMDSYTLVAGANLSYDLYRPLMKPNATDREMVRATKIGVIISWILGYAIAFAFDRIMALLVFVVTILTSTVLVPIMISMFYKGRKTSMAGLSSCAGGLISVLVFYFGLAQIGVYNEVYGTFIWSFTFASESFSIWREYALFYCLPISLVGFLVGNRFGPTFIDPARKQGTS